MPLLVFLMVFVVVVAMHFPRVFVVVVVVVVAVWIMAPLLISVVVEGSCREQDGQGDVGRGVTRSQRVVLHLRFNMGR